MRKDQRRRLLATILRAITPTKSSQPVFQGTPERVVILAQEKLGDAILLTPLFKNLKTHFPNLCICVATFGKNDAILRQDPNVDKVLVLRHFGRETYNLMFRESFDLLFNTKDHPSWTYLLYSSLIRAKIKVGIDHEFHKGLYHHLLGIDFQKHIVEKNCALLAYLGCKVSAEDCRPTLNISSASKQIKDFAQMLERGKLIGINLSAGEASREWPFEKYERLIGLVQSPVIVFSMPERLGEKKRLEQTFEQVKPSPVTKSLFDVGALLKQLTLLITPDTSLVHVASCFNIPVVGLYRADAVHLSRFSPYLTNHVQLISPSSTIRDIEVESVLNAVKKLHQDYESG